MRYICLAIIAAFVSILLATPSSAADCPKLVQEYGNYFIQNTCNKAIGPVSFCWQSNESSCSCFHGSGCSAGPIKPGKRETIVGPGRDAQTRINFNYCIYDDWLKGKCSPKNFR